MSRTSDHPTHVVLVTIALLWTIGSIGCAAPPLRKAAIEDESLLVIHDSLEDVVRAARADDETDWHSGWVGNLWVNFWGDENLGLCYHWQEWVYQEMLPTVEALGWASCGVAVNMETAHEHHAVIVYDPRTAQQERLLEDIEGNPSWVLDAWRRGRPDIYTMADWLTLPAKIEVPAVLEDLPWHEDLDLPFREQDWVE